MRLSRAVARIRVGELAGSGRWRAAVQGGRIAGWQVYADNEPFRASLPSDTPPD